MKIVKYCVHLAQMLCLLSVSLTVKAQDDEFKVQLLSVTPQMEATAAKVMQNCVPQEGKEIGGINKNGVYTLIGDLFHNGGSYSLIDDDNDVILCEWQNSAWKVVSAINVHTAWTWPQGYREQVGRGADVQPSPFWIIDFQKRPLLVIASWVEKEGQNYYVVLFDSRCEKILSATSSFGLRPAIKGQYLLTGNSSRVKASWEATYFSRLQNHNFVILKSWEDSQPWHSEDREGQPDDSSNYASSNGKGYLILPDNSSSQHPADYVVLRCEPKENRSYLYPSNMHDKQCAAIYFTPNKDVVGDNTLVYLFEKLTGLPRELFPNNDQMDTLKQKPEPQWKVRVTGGDQALVKLLSTDSEH